MERTMCVFVRAQVGHGAILCLFCMFLFCFLAVVAAIFCLFHPLNEWHNSVCMSRQFGVFTSMRGHVRPRPLHALAFAGDFTFVETAGTTEGQRSISSHIHEWYECFASLSIYSLLPALHNLVIWCSSAGHSANWAFTQDCVLSFLTEIIFRSITLRMPSHLSNIKWL